MQMFNAYAYLLVLRLLLMSLSFPCLPTVVDYAYLYTYYAYLPSGLVFTISDYTFYCAYLAYFAY